MFASRSFQTNTIQHAPNLWQLYFLTCLMVLFWGLLQHAAPQVELPLRLLQAQGFEQQEGIYITQAPTRNQLSFEFTPQPYVIPGLSSFGKYAVEAEFINADTGLHTITAALARTDGSMLSYAADSLLPAIEGNNARKVAVFPLSFPPSSLSTQQEKSYLLNIAALAAMTSASPMVGTVKIKNIKLKVEPAWWVQLRSLIGLGLLLGVLIAFFNARAHFLGMASKWASPAHAPYALAALVTAFVILIFTFLKTQITHYPIIFGDELLYSLSSKFKYAHTSVTEIGIYPEFPNHVYFALFHAPFNAGINSLTIVKFLNALCYSLAAFPLFFCARAVLGQSAKPWHCAAIAALWLVGGYSVYAHYGMPEALYLLGFSLWLALQLLLPSLLKRVLASAVLLAIMVMIKPHAIALLLITILYLAWCVQQTRASLFAKCVQWLTLSAALLFFAWLTRVLLAYVLTGQWELSWNAIQGEYYRQATHSSLSLLQIMKRIPLYVHNLRGHASVILLSFGIPILLMIMLGAVQSGITAKNHARVVFQPGRTFLNLFSTLFSSTQRNFVVLIFIGMTVLISMSAKFAVDVSGTNEFETGLNLHGRYYGFILPALWLMAAMLMSVLQTQTGLTGPLNPHLLPTQWRALLKNWKLWIFVSSAIIFFWATFHYAFRPFAYGLRYAYFDYPDAATLVSGFPHGVLACMMVAIACWLWQKKSVAWVLAVAVCVQIALTPYAYQQLLAREPWSIKADKRAIAIKQLIPDAIRDAGVMVYAGEDPNFVRNIYHLASLARPLHLAPNQVLREVSIDRRWVLVLDGAQVDLPVAHKVVGQDFELLFLK